MASSSFHWEGDLTEQRIQQIGPAAKRAMVAVVGRTAPQAEAWMKSNARWTDRTGNARNGLGAQPSLSRNKAALVLYHSVPYGIYLELRWAGRYAIIRPAIEHFGPIMMQSLSRLLFTEMGKS